MDLSTESRNDASKELDLMSIRGIADLMNQEDGHVIKAVSQEIPMIEQVILGVVSTFQKGGRLIYIGAGTSGRLGVLDAAECVPTFGTSPEQVIGLIAGGKKALTVAVEGAEDSYDLGKNDLEGLSLAADDFVIGIAASGRTPYVIGALTYANSIGAQTASLACNKESKIGKVANHKIEINVGSEVLTGSTRLKAGTAQKLVLNMISTISMIQMGKVYQNLMVDVKPTNIKLVDRAKRIIMEATDCSLSEAEQLFYESDQKPKIAIIMYLANVSKEVAIKLLENGNGFIREAVAIKK